MSIPIYKLLYNNYYFTITYSENCLKCPNLYQLQVQPGMSYEKINTGLYGEENRLKKEQIYEQFVPLEGTVFLCMYFAKLSEINSNFSGAPKMKTPEAKAMVRDVCFILKLICKEEINEKCGLEEDKPSEGEKTENSKQSKAVQRGRGRNKEPLLSDVVSFFIFLCLYKYLTNISFQLNDLSTHLAAIWKIAKFYSSEEESEEPLNKSIEELSIAVLNRFPEFIKLALNSEDFNVKSYWTRIHTKYLETQKVLSEKTRTPRKRRGSASSTNSDETVASKNGTRTPHRRERAKSVVSDVEMEDKSEPQPTTSKTSTMNKTPSKKTPSKSSSKKTLQKSKLRKKKLLRSLTDSSDSDGDSVIQSCMRTPKKSTKLISSSDESDFKDTPLFSTFDKIKLSK